MNHCQLQNCPLRGGEACNAFGIMRRWLKFPLRCASGSTMMEHGLHLALITAGMIAAMLFVLGLIWVATK
jgi:Flp pilus assembly pilin Flp